MIAESEEIAVKPLPPEQIIKERAAARTTDLPDEPMDAAESDVIAHPSASFNDMASKLEKAMSEVNKRPEQKPTADTGPKDNLKITDSKKKPETAEAKEPTLAPPDELETKTITSAKAADWKALKDKLKAHEAQAKEWETKHKLVETEYQEFRKKAGDVAVIEQTKAERDAIKAERDKLQAHLETVALEKSETFSSFYQEKFDTAIKAARDASGAEADKIEQLMNLPPTKWRKEQINAIREELTGVDQGQLDIAIAEFDRARADKESKLKDSKTNYKKLMEIEADRAAQNKLATDKRREAVTASVLTLAKDFDSFKPSDDAATNAAVAKNEDFVRRFIGGQMEGTDLALMPILAVEAKRYKESVIPSMAKQIEELKAALAQYQGANPNPTGGTRVDSKGGPKSFMDAFNEAWPQGNR